MSLQLQGTVSFIHHQKGYATIQYQQGNRKKSINGLITDTRQAEWIAKKTVKKAHFFRVGDEVHFVIHTDAGGHQSASPIIFLYNNALSTVLQKAGENNKFTGYLKQGENGEWFVKEAIYYVVFRLQLSPWELPPPAGLVNEAVYFELQHFDNAEKVTAILYRHEFTSGYQKLVQWQQQNKTVPAIVEKVTPHACFAKPHHTDISIRIAGETQWQPGQQVQLNLSFVGPFKIVAEIVNPAG
jgi:cold shock CspA family protein